MIDLSDASAQLSWADGQIEVLTAQIASYRDSNPYEFTSNTNPEGWTEIYIALATELPPIIGAQVAAIIQAQRASLDYLAVALAEANGASNPTDVYFPIVKYADALTDKATLKKLRRLNAADQKLIMDLKPHFGGNDTLFALHSLNIERKHRRLGVFGTSFVPTSFGGQGRLESIILYEPSHISKTPALVARAKFDGEMKIDIAIDVAFREVPGAKTPPPVVHQLREFSSTCRAVLSVFAQSRHPIAP